MSLLSPNNLSFLTKLGRDKLGRVLNPYALVRTPGGFSSKLFLGYLSVPPGLFSFLYLLKCFQRGRRKTLEESIEVSWRVGTKYAP